MAGLSFPHHMGNPPKPSLFLWDLQGRCVGGTVEFFWAILAGGWAGNHTKWFAAKTLLLVLAFEPHVLNFPKPHQRKTLGQIFWRSKERERVSTSKPRKQLTLMTGGRVLKSLCHHPTGNFSSWCSPETSIYIMCSDSSSIREPPGSSLFSFPWVLSSHCCENFSFFSFHVGEQLISLLSFAPTHPNAWGVQLSLPNWPKEDIF